LEARRAGIASGPNAGGSQSQRRQRARGRSKNARISQTDRARSIKAAQDERREEFVVARYFELLRPGVTPRAAREAVARDVARGCHLLRVAELELAEAMQELVECRDGIAENGYDRALRKMQMTKEIIRDGAFAGCGTYCHKSVARTLRRLKGR
jgi:hypothetical protein